MNILKHKGFFVLVVLLALQCYLYIGGPRMFSYWVNPILFVLSSYFLFHFFLLGKKSKTTPLIGVSQKQIYLVFAIGILCLLSSYEELRKIFVTFPLPTPNSDVIGQLEALYLRWAQGVFPYKTVVFPSGHSPYPVYMPTHWLPMGIGLENGIDTRWSGLIMYVVCSAVFIALLLKRCLPFIINLLIAILPAFVLWLHVLFLPVDIAVSPEYLIGGYYLLLGAALIRKNIFWITIGVILCLLSRYTFIFWLPVLFIYGQKEFGWKKLLIALGSVVVAFLVIYVIPFLLIDTAILTKGVNYHNQCAIGELQPSGHDPMGWSFSYGLHFALYFRTIFKDMPSEQLGFVIRTVQALIMIVTCAFGMLAVRKKKFVFGKYSVAYLYLTVLLFFSFSPLSYRYYYFVLISLTAVLLASHLYDKGEMEN